VANNQPVPRLELKTPVGSSDLKVSTVRLPHYVDGLDPAPYETIVMSSGAETKSDDPEREEDLEQFRRRYDTEAEAREGHEKTIKAVVAYLQNPQ
jgi:hypothetical protein